MTEFNSAEWEIRWKVRAGQWRDILEEAYPEWFHWDWHCTMVQEMCKTEVELEMRDEAIATDIVENSWQDNARSRCRDALFRYRRELLITPKMRSGLRKTKEEETGRARLSKDPDLTP